MPMSPEAVMARASAAKSPSSEATSRCGASAWSAARPEAGCSVTRLVVIELVHRVADLPGDAAGGGLGSHEESQVVEARLGEGADDLVHHRAGEVLLPRVSHHADDGGPLLSAVERQPPADGILIGEAMTRERLVHHHHRVVLIAIGAGEAPTAHQRDAERAEILGSDRVERRLGGGLPIVDCLSLDDVAGTEGDGAAKGDGVGHRHRDGPGRRGEPLDQAIGQRPRLRLSLPRSE